MNVMLVDDDRDCLNSLNSALGLHGFNVRSFESPVQALQIFQENPRSIDVVITDYHLPGMTGTDLLKKIHLEKPHAPVIIISGGSIKNIKTICRKAGARAFFSKPLNIKQVISKLKQLTAMNH